MIVKCKKAICLALVAIMLVGVAGSVSATVAKKNVSISYNNVKVVVNGSQITPKDATGKTVEPFILDGTTYLPVRAVGDSLGMVVGWDSKTATVTLSGNSSGNSDTLYQEIDIMNLYTDIAAEANFQKNTAHNLLDVMSMSLTAGNETAKTQASIKSQKESLSDSGINLLRTSAKALELKYESSHAKDAIAEANTMIDKMYASYDKLKSSHDQAITYLTNFSSSTFKSFLDDNSAAELGFFEVYSSANQSYNKHRFEIKK